MHPDINMAKWPNVQWKLDVGEEWITSATESGASIISHLWSRNFDLTHESTGSQISFRLFAKIFTAFLMEMQLDNRTFESRKVRNGIKFEWIAFNCEIKHPIRQHNNGKLSTSTLTIRILITFGLLKILISITNTSQ